MSWRDPAFASVRNHSGLLARFAPCTPCVLRTFGVAQFRQASKVPWLGVATSRTVLYYNAQKPFQ